MTPQLALVRAPLIYNVKEERLVATLAGYLLEHEDVLAAHEKVLSSTPIHEEAVDDGWLVGIEACHEIKGPKKLVVASRDRKLAHAWIRAQAIALRLVGSPDHAHTFKRRKLLEAATQSTDGVTRPEFRMFGGCEVLLRVSFSSEERRTFWDYTTRMVRSLRHDPSTLKNASADFAPSTVIEVLAVDRRWLMVTDFATLGVANPGEGTNLLICMFHAALLIQRPDLADVGQALLARDPHRTRAN